jgi:hypothetical protein
MVTVTDDVMNQAPECGEPLVLTVGAGMSVSFAGNASDADGDALTYSLGAAPANGMAVVNPDGTGSYTPNAGFSGTDSFTLVVSDGNGGMAECPVMVTVVAGNRPPVCGPDLVLTVEEDGSVSFSGNASDPDGDVLTYTVGAAPANGTVALNGTGTYTPNADYHGGDSFTLIASDGAESIECPVVVTVSAVNDDPSCSPASGSGDSGQAISITLEASDVDGDALSYAVGSGPSNGSASISGNVATYTSNAGFCGTDSFTFVVSDGNGGSADCEVTVTVGGGNHAPTGVIVVSPRHDLGDTVSGIVVIAPDGELACVELDGSESFDEDADGDCGAPSTIVSYTWLDAAGNVLGTGPVIEVCLPVGPQEITLVVDDGEAVGETTVTVEILTPCEAVEELVMQVEESVIERGNKRPFLATLKAACAAFDRGSYNAAINNLQKAFQNKVRAQVGKGNPDVAEEWIRIAQVIVDAIGLEHPSQGNGPK